MPRCTFTTGEICHIEIRGEISSFNANGALEHDCKDGGLIDKFLKFLDDQEIYLFDQYREIGVIRGFFRPENMEKIEAWLLEQGAEHRN